MKNKQFEMSEDMILRVLAIILALTLWVYVQAQQPVSVHEETFKDIEIQWVTDDNYVVTAVTAHTADVTIRGLLDEVSSVRKEDITISLNLQNFEEGQHTISLVPKLPNGLRFYTVDPVTIDVVLDKLKKVEFEPELEFVMDLSTEVVVRTIDINPSTITIEGPENIINEISRVVVPYDFEVLGLSATGLKPEARDVYNKPINTIIIKDNIDVTLEVEYQKWVQVNVIFTEDIPDGLTYSIKPARISIVGSKEQVNEVSVVNTEEIDISNVVKGTEIEVPLVFPEGLEPTIEEYRKIRITFE